MARATTKPKEEIPESKIRQAIWYLKEGKTKKFVCEHLGIAYNTKRLDSIIENFKAAEVREKELRDKAKVTPLSEAAIEDIINSYANGETQTSIATRYYVSAQRIKNVLLTGNIPIRARKRNAPATTEHITQDLETKLKKGDRVFFGTRNCFAFIKTVFDEDYIEYLKNGRQRYIETYTWNPAKSKYSEPMEGIHYEIYWEFGDNESMKLGAVERLINNIENHITNTGREYYRVWLDNDYAQFAIASRDELFPVELK